VATRAFLPDWLYWGGALRPGLALEVDEAGLVVGATEGRAAADVERLAGRALLPGLVNAHSHAFQRLIRGRTEFAAGGERDDFWTWREAMFSAASALDPEGVFVASRQAFLEMALAGITCVGEFHYLHRDPDGRAYADPDELSVQVVRAAREVGIRIALLRVGYARSGFRTPENPRQRRFIDSSPDEVLRAADRLRTALRSDEAVSVGIAPHSVRAVPRSWLEEITRAWDGVVHMHAAEQPAEVEACVQEHGLRPIELAAEIGMLGSRFTAVHAIHLSDGEIAALGSAAANVCACPSTERNLGDGVVPADRLLAAGAHLALGTDSQASIDLLEDARQLELHLRLVRLRRAVLDPGRGEQTGLARVLFGTATEGGARSLGLSVGRLRPGAPADFFTVDLHHPSLVGAGGDAALGAIVFGGGPAAVRDVYVAGRSVVREGRHALEEQSGRAFSALARRIFG
jgi:formimidoylglutamate deiminase